MSDDSTIQAEYLDDPEFQLAFVNKKSTDRVQNIVKYFKDSLQTQKVQVDPVPFQALKRLSIDQSKILNIDVFPLSETDQSNISISSLLNTTPTPVKSQQQLPIDTPLKPFLFPSIPPPGISGSDSLFQEQRNEILKETTFEQHHLLWAFQDRLLHDLSNENENKSMIENVFNQIAKTQVIPLSNYSQNSYTNESIQLTQNQAQVLSHYQIHRAKMLSDQKLFLIHNTNEYSKDNELRIPTLNPFSFLSNLSK